MTPGERRKARMPLARALLKFVGNVAPRGTPWGLGVSLAIPRRCVVIAWWLACRGALVHDRGSVGGAWWRRVVPASAANDGGAIVVVVVADLGPASTGAARHRRARERSKRVRVSHGITPSAPRVTSPGTLVRSAMARPPARPRKKPRADTAGNRNSRPPRQRSPPSRHRRPAPCRTPRQRRRPSRGASSRRSPRAPHPRASHPPTDRGSTCAARGPSPRAAPPRRTTTKATTLGRDNEPAEATAKATRGKGTGDGARVASILPALRSYAASRLRALADRLQRADDSDDDERDVYAELAEASRALADRLARRTTRVLAEAYVACSTGAATLARAARGGGIGGGGGGGGGEDSSASPEQRALLGWSLLAAFVALCVWCRRAGRGGAGEPLPYCDCGALCKL